MNVPKRFFTATRVLVLCGISILSSTGFGQTRAIKLDDLAKQADIVAVGRVADMKSEWSADKTHITTRVTLAVQEYLKGDHASTVTITTLGGEVGEVGELYTHVPTFRQNETVVVFLEKATDGRYRVAGGTQGKYLVEPDPVTGMPVVAGQDRLEEFTSRVRAAATR